SGEAQDRGIVQRITHHLGCAKLSAHQDRGYGKRQTVLRFITADRAASRKACPFMERIDLDMINGIGVKAMLTLKRHNSLDSRLRPAANWISFEILLMNSPALAQIRPDRRNAFAFYCERWCTRETICCQERCT